MLNKIKNYLIPSVLRNLKVEESKEAAFDLLLDDLEIGRLIFTNGKWVYSYSEEFKENHGLKALAGFPDIEKTYVSEELWPFFMSRIPSLSRDRVKKQIEKEGIAENDILALLNRFGKRTVTNPFVLQAAE